jgi:hypothetical protein
MLPGIAAHLTVRQPITWRAAGLNYLTPEAKKAVRQHDRSAQPPRQRDVPRKDRGR